MSPWGWFAIGLAVMAYVAAVVVWRPMWSALRAAEYEKARREFHRSRERLEAKFLQLASASGRPRGLRWLDCEFENDVTYARDRQNGELTALVAVTISFEAIEGGGMEHVEAVSNLRAATAVFRLSQGQWATDGRAIFNLNPTEAIDFYKGSLVMVGQEQAQRT